MTRPVATTMPPAPEKAAPIPALLPCPFCGVDGSIEEGLPGHFMAICVSCYCNVGENVEPATGAAKHMFKSADEAAEAWNRRAARPPAGPDVEEALRLAEVGEYLYSARAYNYGNGYTEPREYGIEWQWQQSKPDEYGQGILLAEAAKWHEEQAAGGTLTEAAKLRALLSAPSPDREASDGEQRFIDTIRSRGWMVAVHNDYRLNGEPHTFWLFTKDGLAVKGEGHTDAIALGQVVAAIHAIEFPALAAPSPDREEEIRREAGDDE